jgi:WXXGXW repeat (2 copies)
MRNIRHFTLSAALIVLATGVLSAGTATAQPQPPMPPGMSGPFMPGDLHVRIVTNAPPERQREVRTERPDRNHVWQGGYWHHTGSDWNWNNGRWAPRPQARASWVAPRYQKVRGGVRYIPGHWSHEHVIYN